VHNLDYQGLWIGAGEMEVVAELVWTGLQWCVHANNNCWNLYFGNHN
jgi:hypothetical protein